MARDKAIHLGLIPKPYTGDLKNGSIFILMLNPGLSPGDYYAEYEEVNFKNALRRNLNQENSDGGFPFVFLNPAFSWHPGFTWWHEKLQSVIHALSKQKKISYRAALQVLAKVLVSLELFPYHSKKFLISDSILGRLPSSRAMIDYVHDVVIRRVQQGEAIIIATRRARNWDLPQNGGIIIYRGGETRSAHLSLTSRGGRAIARHLGLEVK